MRKIRAIGTRRKILLFLYLISTVKQGGLPPNEGLQPQNTTNDLKRDWTFELKTREMPGLKSVRNLGPYKYLPVFFLLGAGIEFFMIKVRIGKETFCMSF